MRRGYVELWGRVFVYYSVRSVGPLLHDSTGRRGKADTRRSRREKQRDRVKDDRQWIRGEPRILTGVSASDVEAIARLVLAAHLVKGDDITDMATVSASNVWTRDRQGGARQPRPPQRAWRGHVAR